MIKNLKNIICLITIIFLTVSCLFLYNVYRDNSIRIKSLNQKIVELEKQKQELENTPPLGWKEYRNKKYNFKMWYPEKVNDSFYGLENVGVTELSNDNISSIYGIDFFLTIIEDYPQPRFIYIYIYKTDLDIKEAIKDDLRKDRRYRLNKDKQYSDIEIISGIQQIKSKNLDLYKFGNNGDYYFKKDDLLFAFIPSGSISDIDNYQQIYEIMVQSFKFIE